MVASVSNLALNVTSLSINIAAGVSRVLNSGIGATQAGNTSAQSNGNQSACCGELWDEIKGASKETWSAVKDGAKKVGNGISDIYYNGAVPAADWINHNVNPVYLVWNAGYSHFTQKDFLTQQKIPRLGSCPHEPIPPILIRRKKR